MNEEIKLSKRRYLVLILHCFLVFHINSQWTQFQVIADICREYFKVTNVDLDWTVTIWYPVYMAGCFISSIALDKIGIRFCVIMASLANLTGCLVKYFSIVNTSFALVQLGQALASVGQVFTFFLPACIASTWFPAEIASTITAIALFPVYIGGGAGYLLPPLLVPNDTSPTTREADLKRFHLIYTVSAGIILIANCLLFTNKPKYPPSLAFAKASRVSIGFLKAWKSILTNRNSNFILICYASLQSITNVILALLSPMIEKAFPGENTFIGITGAVVLVTSIPGSALEAWITDKTRRYRLVTFLFGLAMFPLFGLFYLALQIKSKALSVFIPVLMGLVLGGTYPIGIDFIVQSNYPLPEAICATLMMFFNQAVSWPLTEAVSYLLHNYNLIYSVLPIFVILIIAMISAFFTKENLNRDDANNESSNISQGTLNQSYLSTNDVSVS